MAQLFQFYKNFMIILLETSTDHYSISVLDANDNFIFTSDSFYPDKEKAILLAKSYIDKHIKKQVI